MKNGPVKKLKEKQVNAAPPLSGHDSAGPLSLVFVPEMR